MNFLAAPVDDLLIHLHAVRVVGRAVMGSSPRGHSAGSRTRNNRGRSAAAHHLGVPPGFVLIHCATTRVLLTRVVLRRHWPWPLQFSGHTMLVAIPVNSAWQCTAHRVVAQAAIEHSAGAGCPLPQVRPRVPVRAASRCHRRRSRACTCSGIAITVPMSQIRLLVSSKMITPAGHEREGPPDARFFCRRRSCACISTTILSTGLVRARPGLVREFSMPYEAGNSGTYCLQVPVVYHLEYQTQY